MNPSVSQFMAVAELPGGGVRMQPVQPARWVAPPEAARVFGKSVETVRRWVYEGELPEQLPDGTPVVRKRTPKLWEFNLPALEQIQQGWTAAAQGKACHSAQLAT